MRHVLTGIGLIAAVVLIAASGAMNFSFWRDQMGGGSEGNIAGSVSVAFDIFKSLLPVYIGWAFDAQPRNWWYIGIGSPVFALLFAGAVVAAIGFISTNRGEVVGGRNALNAQLTAAKGELAELTAASDPGVKIATPATIEARLKAMQQNRRWAATSQCTDATKTKSRTFCETYFDEKGRLSAAIKAERINKRRESLREEVKTLRTAGAGQEADPQASLLSRIIPGFDISRMQVGLMLFFAVLVEIGAASGPYLVLRHGGLARRAALIGNRVNIANTKHSEADHGVSQDTAGREKNPGKTGLEAGDGALADVIPLHPSEPEPFVDDDARRWAGDI